MKVAIMQPYFMPYIGYFQLIHAVDKFVIYDNIEYTKKGWINRNRISLNEKDIWLTISLKRDSDYLDINQRKISNEFNRQKQIRLIKNVYNRAPNIKTVMPLLEKIFYFEDDNLFNFILNSITEINKFLGITTQIIISSSIEIDHSLKSSEKVKTICKQLKSETYINPIGGTILYSKEDFANENIKLKFIKSNDIIYTQNDSKFIPWLSIIDVLMFNSPKQISEILNNYELL